MNDKEKIVKIKKAAIRSNRKIPCAHDLLVLFVSISLLTSVFSFKFQLERSQLRVAKIFSSNQQVSFHLPMNAFPPDT